MRDLYIFGAQEPAQMTDEAISALNPDRQVKAFIVTRVGENTKEFSGKPVFSLKEFSEKLTEKEKENIEIMIVAMSSVPVEIEALLEKYGFYHHIYLTPEHYSELLKLYFAKIGKFKPLAAYPVGPEKAAVQVYMIKSHVDAPLNREYSIPDYMIPIQAGAALTDRSVARVKDNTGDNISALNGNYCELTALYWMWKNKLLDENCSDKQYFGLVHYRRRLDLSEEDLYRIGSNDVDVILPYPYPYEPSIRVHHEGCVEKKVWENVLVAMKELYPEYEKALPSIMEGRYMHVCNVIIAKSRILSEYCGWLFPILERTMELTYPYSNQKINRQAGYVAESLENVYFQYNKEKLRIACLNMRKLV